MSRSGLLRAWHYARPVRQGCSTAIVALLVAACGGARSEPWRGWPVAPQHSQHPLRGFLAEPRPAGFHIGIDVLVRDDRPERGAPSGTTHRVYAVAPGRVSLALDRSRLGCVHGRVDVGHFAYLHLVPSVRAGDRVRPGNPIGWTCKGLWHVHLSEWAERDGRRLWVNPLRPGGTIAPYADARPPRVGPALFFTSTGARLAARRLYGLVELRVRIEDPHSFRGFLTGPLAPLTADGPPSRVRIRVGPIDRVLRLDAIRLDGLALADGVTPGWVFAAGTRQNLGAKRCLDQQPRPCAGAHWLRPLGPLWDTRALADGEYRLEIDAWDAVGNLARAVFPIRVANG